MNVLNEIPLNNEKMVLLYDIMGFAFSLQGSSHIESNTPCQDYNDIRIIDKSNISISAIADGVGSCKLSHWGAYTAVNSSLDFLEMKIKEISHGQKLILDNSQNEIMKHLLVESFRTAQRAVEKMADEANIAVYNFQSTLTVAVYDGSNLFFAHVGDDGIVAQTQDGNVEMVTQRLKGEEASSVYPLQSGEQYWTFGRSSKPVTAFMMATDGVLDAFVSRNVDAFGVNYFNGICYSFMEEAVYKLAENTKESAEETLNIYKEYMLSPGYRNVVTDDLTLVTVVNPELVNESVHPKFNKETWDAIEKENNRKKQSMLWGNSRENRDSLASLSDFNEEGIESGLDVPIVVHNKKKKLSKTKCIFAVSVLLICIGVGLLVGRNLLNKGKEVVSKVEKPKSENFEKDKTIKDNDIVELRRKQIAKEKILEKPKLEQMSGMEEKKPSVQEETFEKSKVEQIPSVEEKKSTVQEETSEQLKPEQMTSAEAQKSDVQEGTVEKVEQKPGVEEEKSVEEKIEPYESKAPEKSELQSLSNKPAT